MITGFELLIGQTSGAQDPVDLLGHISTQLEEALADGELDAAGPGTQPFRTDPSSFIVNGWSSHFSGIQKFGYGNMDVWIFNVY